MDIFFDDCFITGQLLIVPKNERTFVEDMKEFNFSEARSIKLKTVMGYDKHRVVNDGVCVSDMVIEGFKYLFNKGLLNRNEIDAMVLVTSSPDHFLPPTTAIIHGALGLKEDMLCLDVTQGCCGYIVGLIQAFSILNQPNIKKVAVVTGDVLSRKVSRKDRNSYPLIGDAASISIVERKNKSNVVRGNIKIDGSRNKALIIPAGGFRTPSTAETALLEDAGDNNYRAKDNLVMDGSAVFNFVMEKTPNMIMDLLKKADTSLNDVDYFLFHQPNRFMLEKLADDMNVPHSKMPNNVVETYGNSSGTTIPAVIALTLSDKISKKSYKVCFAGFGVGLTWTSLLLDLGPMEFCETLEFTNSNYGE